MNSPHDPRPSLPRGALKAAILIASGTLAAALAVAFVFGWI
jgi:hypothetical protein